MMLFLIISTLILSIIVIYIVSPLIANGKGIGVVTLQFAFFKPLGQEIVSQWNIEAFNQWIFTDYLFALSYASLLASVLLYLEKTKHLGASIYPYVALSAGLFDWIENSIEWYFINDMEGCSSILFFLHSVFASLKWVAIFVVLGVIVKRFWSQSAPMR